MRASLGYLPGTLAGCAGCRSFAGGWVEVLSSSIGAAREGTTPAGLLAADCVAGCMARGAATAWVVGCLGGNGLCGKGLTGRLFGAVAAVGADCGLIAGNGLATIGSPPFSS